MLDLLAEDREGVVGAVADREHVEDVVGGQHDDEVVALVGHVGQDRPHLRCRLDVEGGQRLVEQQRRRLRSQGPGEGDPGGLAAGEPTGSPVGEGAHAHDLEPVVGERPGRSSTVTEAAGAEGDVVPHAEVGEELRRLAHQHDPATVRRHAVEAAAAEDDPAPVGRGQPGDDRQQRGLAGAVGPGQRVPPRRQGEVDVEPALGPAGGDLQTHAGPPFVVRA